MRKIAIILIVLLCTSCISMFRPKAPLGEHEYVVKKIKKQGKLYVIKLARGENIYDVVSHISDEDSIYSNFPKIKKGKRYKFALGHLTPRNFNGLGVAAGGYVPQIELADGTIISMPFITYYAPNLRGLHYINNDTIVDDIVWICDSSTPGEEYRIRISADSVLNLISSIGLQPEIEKRPFLFFNYGYSLKGWGLVIAVDDGFDIYVRHWAVPGKQRPIRRLSLPSCDMLEWLFANMNDFRKQTDTIDDYDSNYIQFFQSFLFDKTSHEVFQSHGNSIILDDSTKNTRARYDEAMKRLYDMVCPVPFGKELYLDCEPFEDENEDG